MNNKTEKMKNLVEIIREKVSAIKKIELSENAYLQVNKISFERNFEALMNNYKSGDQTNKTDSVSSR